LFSQNGDNFVRPSDFCAEIAHNSLHPHT
jgi:hypothetical protein